MNQAGFLGVSGNGSVLKYFALGGQQLVLNLEG